MAVAGVLIEIEQEPLVLAPQAVGASQFVERRRVAAEVSLPDAAQVDQRGRDAVGGARLLVRQLEEARVVEQVDAVGAAAVGGGGRGGNLLLDGVTGGRGGTI